MLGVFREMVFLMALRFPSPGCFPCSDMGKSLPDHTTTFSPPFSMSHGIKKLGAQMWEMSREPERAVLV